MRDTFHGFDRHGRTSRFARVAVATATLAVATMCAAFCAPSLAQTTRDPWLWPFSSDSIWNTPIGAGANYQPANLGDESYSGPDIEHLVKTTSGTPWRTVYYPGPNIDRDSGTTVSWLGSMRVPDGLIIADSTTSPYSTPNACSAFLEDNGRWLVQLQPTTRTSNTGPIWGYPKTGENIYQGGTYGTHYGSGLSSIGGTIRKGELTGSSNIRHALKLEVWAAKYLYYSSSVPGYRWPADRADSYAGDPNSAWRYQGVNPRLVQGALLALPWGTDINNMGLSSAGARKIAWALVYFGAYIVDDTAQSQHAFCVENGGQGDYNAIPLSDINKIVRALKIVDNNGPGSIGGGGEPRTSYAPPIATLVSNPGFEAQGATQTPSNWGTWPGGSGAHADADYTENNGVARSGSMQLAHWKSSAYEVYTYQTRSGLANGSYTLRAWVQCSGGQSAAFMEAKDFGGAARSTGLPTTSAGKGSWRKTEIAGINVTNGRCTLGFYSRANAGNWLRVDDVEFFKQ